MQRHDDLLRRIEDRSKTAPWMLPAWRDAARLRRDQ